MKISSAVFALPALASGYRFVSPVARVGMGRGCRDINCTPNDVAKMRQQRQDFVDRAFDELASGLDSNRDRRANRVAEMRNRKFAKMRMNEEALQKQQEWVNRAFGIVSEFATDFATAPLEVKERNEALRQQQEWDNRMFGVATDFAAGRASVGSGRSDILQDDNEAFKFELEVPGIKSSNIEIFMEGDATQAKTLIVKGERETGADGFEGVSRIQKLSRRFVLDSTSDTAKVTATLDNGVLTITAPKDTEKLDETIQKISVVPVSDDASTPIGNDNAARMQLDVPGVKASNIDISVEGTEYPKTLKIRAERELGTKREDGSPRTKVFSRSFYLDALTDTDNITATLNTGVLTVTAPKDQKKLEEKIQSIPVVEVSGDTTKADLDISDSEDVALNTISDGVEDIEQATETDDSSDDPTEDDTEDQSEL